jgi:SAM-dependent methyltransferase
MSEVKSCEEQMSVYREAVKSGLYAKRSGLLGKYDNVRCYWEDEITRHYIYPHLKKLITLCQERTRRLRVMDLACGSADGLELLTGIRDRDADLEDVHVNLLTPEVLGFYKGVDLSEELLEQGHAIYGTNPKICFQKADFTEGLPLDRGEEPYDLYFSSYGATSHHNDLDTLVRLLADIAKQTRHYCVVVCDWLGRYSYEWQSLWSNDPKENVNMDYVVSYIYEKEEREQKRDQLQHLTLRLVSPSDIHGLVQKVSSRAKVPIKPLCLYDRSIFTGRHMDTADYNAHAQPIRKAVNALHEINCRTNLERLLIDYVPKPGFPTINRQLEQLQVCWNALVNYVEVLITLYDEQQRCFSQAPPEIPASYPVILKEMMTRMKLVVEGVGWMGLGLPRENIIEPQLGYALRCLVMNLQPGQGCGHGMGAIFEIDKNST